MKKRIITLCIIFLSFSNNPMNHNLVDLKQLDPSFILDMPYATLNNFTKQQLYKSSRALLIQPAAQSLIAANKEFKEKYHCAIKIWDAYRPFHIQEIMWKVVSNDKYVLNAQRDSKGLPIKGGRHNRGCAVDVTLVSLNDGKELIMPTSFDDFSEKAHRNYMNLSQEIINNRTLLENVMEKHGFKGVHFEWWHFDFKGWENYPLLDIPFEELT